MRNLNEDRWRVSASENKVSGCGFYQMKRVSKRSVMDGILTVKKRSMTRVSRSASLQLSVGLSVTFCVASNMAM